jgi:hypothetical protein
MKFRYGAALAAMMLASTGAAAQDCTLKQMASLDMTMLPDGTFAVPVSINGATLQLAVVTGGIFTKISAEAAAKLGLAEVQSGYEIYGGRGKLKLTSATAKSFKVGNNEARYFHLAVVHGAPEVADQPSGDSPTIDGELAPDFLSLFDIEIDMAKKKMNLFSQDHCPGKVVYWTQSGYAELPFRFTSGTISVTPHIQLQMTLDGHEISAALNTGSPGSWIGKTSAAQLYGVDDTSPGVVKSPIASDDFPVYRKQFGLLTLGGLTVQNPQVDIDPGKSGDSFRMVHSEKSRDDPIYGINLVGTEGFSLGMNVLGKLHFYIAYKEKKIYLTAADAR